LESFQAKSLSRSIPLLNSSKYLKNTEIAVLGKENCKSSFRWKFLFSRTPTEIQLVGLTVVR
jgi:hypothetical protein